MPKNAPRGDAPATAASPAPASAPAAAAANTGTTTDAATKPSRGLADVVVSVVVWAITFFVNRTVNKVVKTIKRIEWYVGLAERTAHIWVAPVRWAAVTAVRVAAVVASASLAVSQRFLHLGASAISSVQHRLLPSVPWTRQTTTA